MDPMFETANAGFAQALYEEYLRDPDAVVRRRALSGRGRATGNGHGEMAPARGMGRGGR
jgi:hypothetical protein